MRGSALLRPGTVFIVALGLVIGMGIYNWSESLFPSAEQNGSSKAIDCSTLQVNFVDTQQNGTHKLVYVQTNRDQPYAVTFEGESGNFTRIIDDPAPGEVSEIAAPLSSVEDVEVAVNGCSRVFRP